MASISACAHIAFLATGNGGIGEGFLPVFRKLQFPENAAVLGIRTSAYGWGEHTYHCAHNTNL